MDLHIDNIELQGRLLLVTVSGSVTVDAGLRLFKQVCDTAAENRVNKILANALAVDGELTTFERYHWGLEAAAYAQQHQMNLRLAIVGKPPTFDGFGVRVSQNRGSTFELFSSQAEALGWLDRWPN